LLGPINGSTPIIASWVPGWSVTVRADAGRHEAVHDEVTAQLLRVPALRRFREIALRLAAGEHRSPYAFSFIGQPMLISVGLGPYRQTPLLQGSPRLSIDAHSCL
jgi:hypothetical protein